MEISLYKLDGNGVCVSEEKANKLYNKIMPYLYNAEHIEICFHKVSVIDIPFLDASIGEVYRKFGVEQVKRFMSFCCMSIDHTIFLRKIVEKVELEYLIKYKKAWNDPSLFAFDLSNNKNGGKL